MKKRLNNFKFAWQDLKNNFFASLFIAIAFLLTLFIVVMIDGSLKSYVSDIKAIGYDAEDITFFSDTVVNSSPTNIEYSILEEYIDEKGSAASVVEIPESDWVLLISSEEYLKNFDLEIEPLASDYPGEMKLIINRNLDNKYSVDELEKSINDNFILSVDPFLAFLKKYNYQAYATFDDDPKINISTGQLDLKAKNLAIISYKDFFKQETDPAYFDYLSSLQFKGISAEEISRVSNLINRDGKVSNFHPLTEYEVEENIEEMGSASVITILLVLILSLLFFLAFLAIVVNIINSNMHEYGIHLLVGATHMDIMTRVAMYLLLVLAFPALVGTIVHVSAGVLFDDLNSSHVYISIVLMVLTVILILAIVNRRLSSKYILENIQTE